MSEKKISTGSVLFIFFFGVGKSWTSPGIKNYFCQPIPFLEPKSSKSGKECNVLSAHVPCCLFVMVSFNQKDLYGKGQVYDRAQKRSVLSSFSGDLNLPQTLLCKNRMTFPFSPWFQKRNWSTARLEWQCGDGSQWKYENIMILFPMSTSASTLSFSTIQAKWCTFWSNPIFSSLNCFTRLKLHTIRMSYSRKIKNIYT